jgi:cell division protein ZapA
LAGYIKINILGKEYSIKSNLDESYLNQIAHHLNQKIEEVVKTTKTVATHNIVLLAAMEIANDYFQAKNRNEELIAVIENKADSLVEYINSNT